MQFPLFTPPTEWVMPDGYPDISDAREVAIDLETNDTRTVATLMPSKLYDGSLTYVLLSVIT